MSNETKRDVFKRTLEAWEELVHDVDLQGEEIHGVCEFDSVVFKYEKDYDAALPDDLPVIPEAVSDYISEAKKLRQWGLLDVFWYLGDNISAMGINGLYDWQRWMFHNQVAVARAWVLGAWRVEETGEIVKLEEKMSDANFEALINTINVSLSGVQEKAAAGDYEVAHSDEDDLREFVLQRIAKADMTIEQAKCLASLALETNNIDFTRWYA